MTIKTADPRLFLPPSGEVTRLAREGCIAEWDMATFDAGNAKLMLDQSGKGANMLFTAIPSLVAAGVAFNGTYWGDATLPLLSGSYSALAVFNNIAPGYYIFGNQTQDAGQNGTMVRGGITAEHGIFANSAVVGNFSAAGVYNAPIIKVQEDNQARVKHITGGILNYTNTLRGEDQADQQTVWRMGGTRQTVAGDPDAIGPFPFTGNLAYAMVWNRLTSEHQDAAIASYLRSKLAPRSVTLGAL
jgi:hypothetical protein